MPSASTTGSAKAAASTQPLSPEELRKVHAYWRAANYLSVGQIYLYANPLAARTAAVEAHQAPAARTLGHDARTEFYLRPFESPDQKTRSRCDLRRGPGTWRAGPCRQHLSRRHLQRGLSAHPAKRRRLAAALQAILVSRRHSQPRRAGNARLDSRRRRTRLFARARLRRGVRQSGSARLLRRWRWRSRNRTVGGELALQQIFESRARWRRSSDSAFERIQNRQSHRARPPERRNLTQLFTGYGYKPYFVEGREPEAMHQLMAHTMDTILRRNSRHPECRAQRKLYSACPLGR